MQVRSGLMIVAAYLKLSGSQSSRLFLVKMRRRDFASAKITKAAVAAFVLQRMKQIRRRSPEPCRARCRRRTHHAIGDTSLRTSQ